MHPKDIVAEVGKRHTTCVQLALANNLSRSAIHYALLKPSRRAEEVLIAFLGLPPHAVFPQRYDDLGNRTVTRGRKRGRPAKPTNIPAHRRTRGQ